MIDWQPSVDVETARKRAELLSQLRQFFAERHVLEVDTPLLAEAPVTDPYLQAFLVQQSNSLHYLQTSPEYAMKRMLAAGFGSIYQICKAFRQDESGALHHPEFTLLEWYRVGFDHHDLMLEIDQLLQQILGTPTADQMSYQQCFESMFAINPHQVALSTLIDLTQKTLGNIIGLDSLQYDDCLQLLFSDKIEPTLGQDRPVFVYDYPVSQAALAKTYQINDTQVAARFELFYQGIELANGYYELTNATEQKRRFQRDLHIRQQQRIGSVPIDQRLLAAIEAGLPDCAGVALGFDRLLMQYCHKSDIAAVIMK